MGHDRSVEEVVDCAIQEDAQAIAMTSYQGGHNEYFKYMYDLLKEKNAHILKFLVVEGVHSSRGDRGITSVRYCKDISPRYGRAMGLQDDK